jgi:hypothetical protein
MCGGTSCFAGQVVRESSKSDSKTVAKDAERARHRELEGSFNRISKPRTAQLFSAAAESWLSTKIAHLSTRSVIIERTNLKHLNPFFGKMLLCDVAADDIARYQAERLEKGAAPKTVNLEVGTLRAILRKNRLWASIQPDVRISEHARTQDGLSVGTKRMRCWKRVEQAAPDHSTPPS